MENRMHPSVRVLIVDEEDLFRRGLAMTLGKDPEVMVVGQARSGEEAIVQARELRPTVVLVELHLPDVSGLHVARTILRDAPAPRVAVIARAFSRADLVEAAKAGVCGFLTKDITLETLVDAVKRVSNGEAYISPGSSQLIIAELAAIGNDRSFPGSNGVTRSKVVTEREREVLELIVHGATNRDIAARLMITENTVKVHLRNILDKLQLRNRQQAAAFAISSGLVQLHNGELRHPSNGQKSTPTTWQQRSG